MKAILAFSGPIASGKTTLSSNVAHHLGWKVASFGGFIRKQAEIRGLNPQSREILQDLGNEFIKQGWWSFCLAVLNDSGWICGDGLVIDGIRHLEGLGTIREIVCPQPVYLLFVNVSEQTRRLRLQQRGIAEIAVLRDDLHDTERQVTATLANLADLVIDGELPVETAAENVLSWLKRLQKVE